MQTLTDQLNTIEEKVRQLALKLERVQQENVDLTAENKKLKASVYEKSTLVKNLESKTTNLSTADNTKQEKSSKKLRKEIEQYIKEIDKCLEWLQNS